MLRRNLNWDKVAETQFESLDKDIREDWSDLRKITLDNA
ncbi:MAG: hypothetical protein JWP13_278 [Candidatus Saccharibacteria bacterium]|jgi:hypothetical protein|nr:hypothetical protein [Candidatus Saccharibacteria bacterium]